MKIRTRLSLLLFPLLIYQCAKPKYPSYQEKIEREARILSEKKNYHVNYIPNKSIHSELPNIEYYWFYNYKVGKTKGVCVGVPLEKEYIVYDLNGELLEKGYLKQGIKEGVWLKWANKYKVYESQSWHKGKKIGYNKIYDSNNRLLYVGKSKRNNKWTGKVKEIPELTALKFLKKTKRIKKSVYKRYTRKIKSLLLNDTM